MDNRYLNDIVLSSTTVTGESHDKTTEGEVESTVEENDIHGGLDANQPVENSVESASVNELGSTTDTQTDVQPDTKSEPEPTRKQKGADEKFCSSCGEIIKQQAEICPNCGVRQIEPESKSTTSEKNPGLAAVASFLFTGLGQIYNGQIGKGILLIIVQIINIGLMFAIIGFITFPLVWIYGIYDAYKTAEKINER